MLKIFVWTTAVGLRLVALIGLMHVPAARGLLARAGMTWGCPLPKASPAATEAAFGDATRKDRGPVPATVKLAAGLSLGSTAAQALAALSDHHVECGTKDRGFHYVRCEHVPAAALGEAAPDVDLLTLAFDRKDRLVSVDVWRAQLTPSAGSSAFASLYEGMTKTLGAPTKPVKAPSASSLVAPLSQARAEYHFSDYVAKLSVANIPGRGVAIREQFTDLAAL